jgi:hypothetical protein
MIGSGGHATRTLPQTPVPYAWEMHNSFFSEGYCWTMADFFGIQEGRWTRLMMKPEKNQSNVASKS